MGDMLRAINPFVKPVPRPNTRTKCGGIMAITVVPLILVLYTVFYWGNYYMNNEGAVETTDIKTMGIDQGLWMDGVNKHGQMLKCIAQSGCWYTQVMKGTSPNLVPDNQCPPAGIMNSQIQSAKSLASQLGQASAFTPGAREDDLAGEAGDAVMINKQCSYAAYGEKLEGACLFFTADPIDYFSVVWKGSSAGQYSGVALVTEYPHIRPDDEAAIYGGTQTQNAAGGSTLANIKSDALSALSGNKGGWMGYVARVTPLRVHFGEVQMNVNRHEYQYMCKDRHSGTSAQVAGKVGSGCEGDPKQNVTNLIPTYFSIAANSPDDTNVCYFSGQGGKNNKCVDDEDPDGTARPNSKCRQLKIRPSSTYTVNKRYMLTLTQAVQQYFGALGGAVTLVLMGLGAVHVLLIKVFGKMCEGLFGGQELADKYAGSAKGGTGTQQTV